MSEKKRCDWAEVDDLYRDYHDREWGVPCYDDQRLFEFLILEGAQAGLSWHTILKKRDHYRRAFCGFEIQKVAAFDEADEARLLQDAGIVRNRLKIKSAIRNAKAVMTLTSEGISWSDFLWAFVDGKPIINQWSTLEAVPATTPLSDKLSKALKARGFNFVGSTICYAFMQATGMVNDHVVDCFLR